MTVDEIEAAIAEAQAELNRVQLELDSLEMDLFMARLLRVRGVQHEKND